MCIIYYIFEGGIIIWVGVSVLSHRDVWEEDPPHHGTAQRKILVGGDEGWGVVDPHTPIAHRAAEISAQP